MRADDNGSSAARSHAGEHDAAGPAGPVRGATIRFAPDVPHEYWNDGSGVLRMFLAMTYSER